MSITAAIQSAEAAMAKSDRKELNPIPKKAALDVPSKGLAIGLMCMINSLASDKAEGGADSDVQATNSEAWGDRVPSVNQPEPTKTVDANVQPQKKTASDDDDIEVVRCNFEDDRSTAVGDWDETATSRFSDADGAALSDKDADADSDVDALDEDEDAPSNELAERENIDVDNWRSVAGSLACVFESALVEEEAKTVDVERWQNVAARFANVFQSLDEEFAGEEEEETIAETADPEMWRNVAARMASVFSEEQLLSNVEA